ncbi:carbonic anhydrase 2-like [Humulus lupulus]|uniref:carbonic anhydrase 2-like n=1 Tax=Humulus lupulus TaxID=3486 RepID=UPI002B4036E0|nr:carbonic anhydrase 2-like [Humulus lupulus]
MAQQLSQSALKKKILFISEKEISQEDVAAEETFDDQKLIKTEIIYDDQNKLIKSDQLQAGQDCNATFDPVKRIACGFKHFLIHKFYKYPEIFRQLAEAQHPKFLVFACSDSRVSPSNILNFQPGEAFMARNIANLIPSFDKFKYSGVGAIIEYAVTQLKVENILVIGHSRCGGIKRLMSHPEDGSVPFDFIDNWVQIAQSAKDKVKAEHSHLPFEEQCEICAEEAVDLSLKNLHTYPYVKRAVEEKKIALRGGYYDFVVGTFKLWELA